MEKVVVENEEEMEEEWVEEDEEGAHLLLWE